MQNRFENPLIIQSDRTILLDVHSPRADEARSALIPFAELERSPEHLHTYRLSPLSLWNASSAGFTPQKIAAVLNEFSRYEFPSAISLWIIETAERFGKLRMRTADDETGKSDTGEEILYLITNEKNIFAELQASKIAAKYMTAVLDKTHSIFSYGKFAFSLALVNRGTVKQDLLQIGYPVKDEVPLRDGDPLEVSLREISLTGKPFILRDYQKKAAMALVGDKSAGTGFGTIVLPCGAGKTIVGMYIMAQLKTNTLILTTNISAVHQWIAELIDKTNLTADDIGEYTGECKAIKPVTVATYQVLTWRAQKDGQSPRL